MKTREQVEQRLERLVEDVGAALADLDSADLAVVLKMFAGAIEPLHAAPLSDADEVAKLGELQKGVELLELFKRGRATGFLRGGEFSDLVTRHARRVERLARQLTTPRGRR